MALQVQHAVGRQGDVLSRFGQFHGRGLVVDDLDVLPAGLGERLALGGREAETVQAAFGQRERHPEGVRVVGHAVAPDRR